MICLYLVTEPSYLLIIKRDISPAASSAAGFLFAAAFRVPGRVYFLSGKAATGRKWLPAR
jgi:hypothetical protein